ASCGAVGSPPPFALEAAHATEVKAQESTAFSLGEVNDAALFLIDGDVECGQFLAQAFCYRREQPVVLGIGVDQDHQIISKAAVLNVGVLATSRYLFGPFKHALYLREGEVASQRPEHIALGHALFARVLQDQL